MFFIGTSKAPKWVKGKDARRQWLKDGRWAFKYSFGTGHVLRSADEPFVLYSRGKPKTTNGIRSAFPDVRRDHSRKPDRAYEIAEKLVPNVRRLDLFAREVRPGWDQCGDEVGKFAD